jgi:succinylarginine dihydrolase
MPPAREVNFDGLVGPTHNYAGLSFGNVASMANASRISSPKRAALEGLAKMKFLAGLGLRQGVLPPHERPHVATLRRVGFTGSDAEVLEDARKADPKLLAAVSSSSAMWAANAATISPSADTGDHKVHFTPANLVTNLHRSLEPPMTARVLKTIFADERYFVHHDPLPATTYFSDEGAANHTRLGAELGQHGIEIFTVSPSREAQPTRFPGRQSPHASVAVRRLHQLSRVQFLTQDPAAIDAGAFHNDVVAVGHRNVLLFHERAWLGEEKVLEHLRTYVTGFREVRVHEADVPLADAVATYLFNSQLVTLPNGSMALLAPMETRENERTHAFVQQLLTDGVIAAAHFVDVRESMRNGGGPACLRLRVVLSDEELAATHPGVLLTDNVYEQLVAWVERNYRDALEPRDLADPKLLEESRRALDELTQILRLGSLYDFQRERSA